MMSNNPEIRAPENDRAPYAANPGNSRGRVYPEKIHPYRTEYQRDRERIIHSTAFRRLEYKTQVFINHEGDHYRTRLTHSIEVAQIARSVARVLKLDEDLAEAISLAHDLGHTPFGHAGERQLNDLLKNRGGFEHNRQSLRVVDSIEKRYQDFDGLNLTYETREGIIKHSSPHDHPDAADFNPEEQPTLEAQIIDLADEIAYNNHDLDDGITSGLLELGDVAKLRILKSAGTELKQQGAAREELKLRVREVVRSIINLLVTDLIQETMKNIDVYGIRSLADIRKAGRKITGFSEKIADENSELKKFLKEKLYRHYRVERMTIKAEKVIRELFSIYTENPGTLPDSYRRRAEAEGIHRVVTDYIAGMTDRYALEEHKKLTDPAVRS